MYLLAGFVVGLGSFYFDGDGVGDDEIVGTFSLCFIAWPIVLIVYGCTGFKKFLMWLKGERRRRIARAAKLKEQKAQGIRPGLTKFKLGDNS